MDEEQSYWDSEEKSYFKIHYGKALIFESVDYTLDLNYYTLNDVEYS
ncbi:MULTISPECIES: hypothetical protein [Enterococcus]|jgi:hypothetical protein|nr:MULTISPECIES: hypothetical protein [Enterococcus]